MELNNKQPKPSLENQYNLKSPGVKRLMREACELAEPTEEYFARPLEDNLFEWHFTVRGPPNTEFEGGFYHGRILLPSQYPMQPPNIILLTPNGRFEVNKKICLSISGHHPESWQPSWSIRTALLALIAFMPTHAAGTIGSLDYTPEERQVLAKKSINWECVECGKIAKTLDSPSKSKTKPQMTQEETTLISQIALKAEEESGRQPPVSDPATTVAPSTDSVLESAVRQRFPTDSTTGMNSVSEMVVDAHISIPRNNLDKFFTILAWVIVTLIGLLVLRRVYMI